MRCRLAALAITGFGLSLTACTGSSRSLQPVASAPTGRATLSVRWPATSRLIPFASNAVRITLTQGTRTVGAAILVRPSGGGSASARFDDVPVGVTTITAIAVPGADGSGNAQASGQSSVTIITGQTANVSLTMASTIAAFALSTPGRPIGVGEAVTLTPTARDSAGAVVLTTLATIEWSSSAPSVASVAAGGRIRGLQSGAATIAAREIESGRTATVNLTVSGEITCDNSTGHCDKVVNNGSILAWASAKSAAEAQGGYLACITTAAENAFVFALVDKPEFWHPFNQHWEGPWIGGYQPAGSPEGRGGWRWVSGEPFETYTNWYYPDQADPDSMEDSLNFYSLGSITRSAFWDDSQGTSSVAAHAYVIEWNGLPTSP